MANFMLRAQISIKTRRFYVLLNVVYGVDCTLGVKKFAFDMEVRDFCVCVFFITWCILLRLDILLYCDWASFLFFSVDEYFVQYN